MADEAIGVAERDVVAPPPPVVDQRHDPRDRVELFLSRPLVGAVLLVAAAVLPLLRQRGTPSWQTVWAEDGYPYTQQAILHGNIHSLGLSYQGYWQLPNRLLALPTPYFPVKYLALYAAVVSVVVGALLAGSVYYLAAGWVGSRLLRLALAAMVVLMPALGKESTADITESIWMFLAVLPWALISRRETRRDTWLRSVLALLGATASSMSFAFVPLALGWLAYKKTRATLIVTAAFLTGVVVQGIVTIVASPAVRYVKPTRSLAQLLEGIGTRIFGVFLLGTRWEADLWKAGWPLAAVVAPIVVIGVLVVLAWTADMEARLMAAVLLVLSVVTFSVAAWGRGTNGLLLVRGGHDAQGDLRFSILPVMLLASAAVILIASRSNTAAADTRAWAPAFATLALLVGAVSFPVTTLRSGETDWTTRVDAVARDQCAGRPPRTLVLVPNDTARVSSVPVPAAGFWPMRVHCSDLE